MLKNYFKIAVRSVLKNQVFSLINVMGLAVGMAACVLIMQYVQTEFSYDQFHAKKSDIYRLQQNRYDKGELSTQWAAGCAGVGPALKESLPEVIEQVKMHGSNAVLANGDISFREERTYYASEAFFEIFSYNLIEGVDSLVLKEPYKVVLSESTAKKYFKEENPMGKTLNLNGRWDFEVTGIFEDVPENTHMKFDVLFSFETYVDLVSENARTAWQWDGFYTYIMLEPGTDPKELESKIPAIVEQYAGEELKQFDAGQEFLLQSLSDIHLYSDYMMEFEANGDGDATYFLAIIAVFIMIIAWINYINLATAKSLDRAREVGVRKVMGSFKSQLVKQFLMESFLLNAIAVVLALGIVLVALPYFNTLSGKTLTFALISTPEFWLTLTVLFILGGFLSGLYPAFVLSGFKPVSVLKGKFRASDKGNMLRKGLVIFQFFASVFLMVGTFTVYKQITYMRSQDLGVDIAKTLVLRSPNVTDSTYQSKYDAFKQHIGQYANVEFVSASTAVPGRQPDWNAGGIRRVHQDESYSKQYRIVGGDYDFVEAYQLEMAVGRTF
ncbi:MAG: ABC transporter permease, partial [Bacteroidota bacterium]